MYLIRHQYNICKSDLENSEKSWKLRFLLVQMIQVKTETNWKLKLLILTKDYRNKDVKNLRQGIISLLFFSHWKHLIMASHPFNPHCVKSVRILSYSSPHFPVIGLNTKIYRVSLRIQFEYGKIQTRITPNTDTFYAVPLWLTKHFTSRYFN